MAKKKADKTDHLLGNFLLPDGKNAFGGLSLRKRQAVLKIQRDDFFPPPRETREIYGELHDLQKVSCLDCFVSNWGQKSVVGKGGAFFAEIYPDFVAIGDVHLNPKEGNIRAVHFTTSEIESIFYDFDAFGSFLPLKEELDPLLKKYKTHREVITGDAPILAYFSGRQEIFSSDTNIGKISVNHCPSYVIGFRNGTRIPNQMMISIEPESSNCFDDIIEKILTVRRFFSLVAGTPISPKKIKIEIECEDKKSSQFLSLYWAHKPKGLSRARGRDQYKPRIDALPIDAVNRPKEFLTVLKNWFNSDGDYRIARNQYLDCLMSGNLYTPSRLVAAANMFDLLPKKAFSELPDLDASLAAARDQCIAILKGQPRGGERDSAISALSRMGKLSLRAKIMERHRIVGDKIGSRFPDLPLIIKTAVNVRNYYVHGGEDLSLLRELEPLSPFLTDSLEFVFGASDLIESGWDSISWNKESHSTGHNFVRFRDSYDIGISELRKALNKDG